MSPAHVASFSGYEQTERVVRETVSFWQCVDVVTRRNHLYRILRLSIARRLHAYSQWLTEVPIGKLCIEQAENLPSPTTFCGCEQEGRS